MVALPAGGAQVELPTLLGCWHMPHSNMPCLACKLRAAAVAFAVANLGCSVHHPALPSPICNCTAGKPALLALPGPNPSNDNSAAVVAYQVRAGGLCCTRSSRWVFAELRLPA